MEERKTYTDEELSAVLEKHRVMPVSYTHLGQEKTPTA